MKDLPVSLYLSLDLDKDMSVYDGEPLNLCVTITFTELRYQEYKNEDIKRKLEHVEKQYKQGEISEERYNELKKELESQLTVIPEIDLGTIENPWYKMIKFEVKEDGLWRTCEWKMEMISRTYEDYKIKIQSDDLYMVCYVIPPEEIKKLNQGEYTIRAVLENLENKYYSNEVIFRKIVGEREYMSLENKMRVAEYHLEYGDPEKAKPIIEEFLKKKETIIAGMVFQALYSLRKGNKNEALDILEKALDKFYELYPDPIEPPYGIIFLIRKITMEDENTGE